MMKNFIFEMHFKYAQRHKLRLCSLTVLHFSATRIQVPRGRGTKNEKSIRKAFISRIPLMTNQGSEQTNYTYTFSLVLQTCVMMLHFIVTELLYDLSK